MLISRCSLTLLIVVCLCGIPGCEPVTTLHSLGQPPEPGEWNSETIDGTWVRGDESAWHVHSQGEGKLMLAIVGWDEDQFIIRNIAGRLTQDKGALYLLVDHHGFSETGQAEPNDEPEYLFFRLIPGGDGVFTLLIPDNDYFSEKIEAGKLDGQDVDDNEGRGSRLRILGEAGQLETLLKPEELGEQFAAEHGLILRRVTEEN